jgi:sulfur carrier protein ThiS
MLLGREPHLDSDEPARMLPIADVLNALGCRAGRTFALMVNGEFRIKTMGALP